MRYRAFLARIVPAWALLIAQAASSPVHAQCGVTDMVHWAESIAFESAYDPATMQSSPGSTLTFLARADAFCGPLAFLTASPPDTEYTVVFSGLVSGGTVTSSAGSGYSLTTAYAGGGFRVRRGVPPNAPSLADIPNDPPNATVPSTFDDGEIVLEGVFDDFVTGVSVTGLGFASGQFVASYRVTGGSWADLVEHGSGRMDGGWCPFRTAFYSCAFMRLAGYSGYCASGFAGSIQTPGSVPVRRASWGSLKTRYR